MWFEIPWGDSGVLIRETAAKISAQRNSGIALSFSRFLFIAFILISSTTLIFNFTSYASSREEGAYKVLKDLKRVNQAAQCSKVEDLQQTFEQSQSREERQMASLSLGIHYLEKSQQSSVKTSLQYLTIAETLTKPSDLVAPIIKFYRASARLNGGASREAAKMLGELLKGQLGSGWERSAWSMYVEALYRSGNHAGVVEAYTEYSKKFSPSRREQDVAKLAAMVLEKNGDHDKVIEVLEELVSLYPMSEPSRWAFNKLLDYSCENAAKKSKYIWSRDILLRLSRNTTLESGLKEFIIGRISSPVALTGSEARNLFTHEKVDFFLRAKFFDQAIALATTMLDPLTDIGHGGPSRPRGLILLGRAHAGTNDHMMAVRYFGMFVEEYPGLQDAYRARELMADSLNRLRHYKDAAIEYGKLASIRGYGNPLLMWHHFWNTYLSNDYEGALALLDIPGYVPPRDRNESPGLPYWRARILEKLGRREEAVSLYTQILSSSGDSYYAMLIATRLPELSKGMTKPELESPSIPPKLVPASMSESALILPIERDNSAPLLEADMPMDLSPNAQTRMADDEVETLDEVEGQAVNGAGAFSAKSLKIARKDAESLSPELQLVDNLIDAGLYEQARTQIKGISWRDFAGAESHQVVSRISWVLNDYRTNLNAPYRAGSSLRNRPKDYSDLIRHQKKNDSDWKVYYPMAHERVVKMISNKISISPYFVLSIMRAESQYNADAKSPVGAMGLMQIMPFTGVRIAKLLKDSGFEVSELRNPELNIPYGAYYLKRLQNYYSGNSMLAIASYNAGPVAVRNWLEASAGQEMDEFVESVPFIETRRYVKSVLRNYSFYMRIYENDNVFDNMPVLPPHLPDGEEIF